MFTILAIAFTVIPDGTKVQITTDKKNFYNKISTMITTLTEQKHQLRKNPFNNIVILLSTIINAKNLKIQTDLTEEKINIKDTSFQFHTDLLPNTVLNTIFTLSILNIPTIYTIYQIPKILQQAEAIIIWNNQKRIKHITDNLSNIN